MSNETSVIVVIGSVTAKQYKEVRLRQTRRGVRVKVLRVGSENVEEFEGGSTPARFSWFCDKLGIQPSQVVEAVILESELSDANFGAYNSAFSFAHRDRWPNLEHLSVICEGASGEDWIDLR